MHLWLVRQNAAGPHPNPAFFGNRHPWPGVAVRGSAICIAPSGVPVWTPVKRGLPSEQVPLEWTWKGLVDVDEPFVGVVVPRGVFKAANCRFEGLECCFLLMSKSGDSRTVTPRLG